ncbi:MAG: hypothetical protein U0169_16385 [Polyangiaceae bacterium]
MHRSAPTFRSLAAPALVSVLVAACLGGCKNGCVNEHPYVPYSIGDANPDLDAGGGPSDAQATSDAEATPPGFKAEWAETAPDDVRTWSVGGIEVSTSSDKKFLRGMAGDVDGDGERDVVALVRGLGKTDPGSLVFFHGKKGSVEAPVAVTDVPLAADDAKCPPVLTLARTGPHTAVVESGIACTNATVASGERSVFVVGFSGTPRVRASMVLVDPPNAPKVTLDVDASDADGDGLDDLAFRVSVEGGGAPFEPGPKVGATLRWFDRPAGLSRDADEPEASFQRLGTSAQLRAGKAKEAAAVGPFVFSAKNLFATVCTEGGEKRFTKLVGVALPTCGPSRALEELGLAETRAFAAQGDVLRATAALERAQRAPATRTPNRTNDGTNWILAASPATVATEVKVVAAVPQVDRGKGPTWGPLAFESSGKLLVRTAGGVVRSDPALGDESAAEDVTPWKGAVLAPDKATRWLEAYNPCTGGPIHVTFSPTGDGDLHDLALPIAPALGSRCANAKGEPVPTLPVAWSERGIEMVVAGEPFLVSPDWKHAAFASAPLGEPSAQGGPRSPNGKITVVPTSIGLVVQKPAPRTYRAKEFDGAYADLHGCTVSDDARRVACVLRGKVLVGFWPAP